MLCIDFITYKYVNKQTSTVCQSAKLTSTRAVLIKAPGNISTTTKKKQSKTLYNQIFTWIDIMSLISYWFQMLHMIGLGREKPV